MTGCHWNYQRLLWHSLGSCWRHPKNLPGGHPLGWYKTHGESSCLQLIPLTPVGGHLHGESCRIAKHHRNKEEQKYICPWKRSPYLQFLFCPLLTKFNMVPGSRERNASKIHLGYQAQQHRTDLELRCNTSITGTGSSMSLEAWALVSAILTC